MQACNETTLPPRPNPALTTRLREEAQKLYPAAMQRDRASAEKILLRHLPADRQGGGVGEVQAENLQSFIKELRRTVAMS